MSAPVYTVTALRRWSCQDKQPPSIEQIKSIHVYDFDNTLFQSPLPNKQVWSTTTFGHLQAQEFLHEGGWWHNPAILAATGDGLEKEELRAWEGSWNEKIVELVRLTMEEESAVSVLLTGRSESGFSDLIQRMLRSKGLEFDIVALKPRVSPTGEHFSNTMAFKQAFFRDLVYTYKQAGEIRVYEDRPKHTKAFRDFFEDLNGRMMEPSAPSSRSPITAEVVQVSEQDSYMDPVTEVTEVQRMINNHNQAILNGVAPAGAIPYKIKRSVFYTGYLISPDDTERLRSLVKLPTNCPEHEVKTLANNILITPRPAPHSILNRVGGIGAKLTWRVTGIAHYEHRVWAARVQPKQPGARFFTENATPCVVLATRRQSKPIEATRIQTWQPVPDNMAFEFETIVGEKVLLRIDEEVRNEDAYEASFPNAKNARKHSRDEDFPPLGPSKPDGRSNGQPRPQQRRQNNDTGPGWAANRNGGPGPAAQRGGRDNARGGRGGHQGYKPRGGYPRGGGGRGRGRGGYKSLDANVGQGYGGGGMEY